MTRLVDRSGTRERGSVERCEGWWMERRGRERGREGKGEGKGKGKGKLGGSGSEVKRGRMSVDEGRGQSGTRQSGLAGGRAGAWVLAARKEHARRPWPRLPFEAATRPGGGEPVPSADAAQTASPASSRARREQQQR